MVDTVRSAGAWYGDGIQAAKAGILEIGDIFVVNKVIVTVLRHWYGSCGR